MLSLRFICWRIFWRPEKKGNEVEKKKASIDKIFITKLIIAKVADPFSLRNLMFKQNESEKKESTQC
jgi:hypothetical protein